jgi:two-component system cell cycle sensor histidine kinase/response regulator CckA
MSDAALADAEKRYSDLLHGLRDAVVTADGDGLILEANAACLALLGLKRPGVSGLRLEDLYADPSVAAAHREELLANGQIDHADVVLRRADGDEVTCRLSAWTRRDDPAGARRVTAVMRGMAAPSAEGREARPEAQRHARYLFDSSPSINIVVSADGTIRDISRSGARQLGYEPGDVIGTNALDFVVPEDRTVAAASLKTDFEGGESAAIEIRVVSRDRSVHTISFSPGAAPITEHGRTAAVLITGIDITGRVAAEEALRESEERFRTLIENIGEGVAAIDGDERFVFVNRAATEIFGVEREKLVGMRLQSFVSDEDWKLVLEETERRRKGQTGRYELTIVRPDGGERSIIVTARPRTDDAGRHNGAAVVFLDVTAWKAAERALAESESRYRSLFEELQDVVYITSRDGDLIDISPSAASLFGRSREELLRMDVHDLYACPEDRERFQEAIERKGYVRGFEVRLLDREGRTLQCLLTSTLRRAADGTPVGYQGIIRNITEQKNVERALEVEHRSLAVVADAAVQAADVTELCARALSGFVETLELGRGTLWLRDESGTKVSPVAAYGKSGDEPPEAEPSEHDISDPRSIVGHVVRTGRPLVVADTATVDLPKSLRAALSDSGARATIVCPITGGGGNVIGVLQMSSSEPRDTLQGGNGLAERLAGMLGAALERRRAQDAGEELRAQLVQAQKMEAVGTLASGVAHDFNNLLTAIQGFADLALVEVEGGTSLHSDLEKIRSSAERGSRLVRQLLLFSRRQPMQMAPLDLNTATQGLIKMIAPLIGEDICMSVALESEAWSVLADEASVQQVLMNLAVNARDAMPDGGTLTISTENIHVDDDAHGRRGRYVRVTVTDTGVGMDEETRSHVFEPFFSTKGPGKGTGLGLAVVYGIVEQHQGWIEIDSSPGEGTAFSIYFPATEESAEAQAPDADRAERQRGRGERVLVVEDEQSVRDFASRVLRQNGYEVFEASTVSEALEVYRRENGAFDLVFSDVVLPDRSGVHLVEELLAAHPAQMVLLSSGHADERSQCETIRERGLPFLEKPYSLPHLLRAVSSVLRPN